MVQNTITIMIAVLSNLLCAFIWQFLPKPTSCWPDQFSGMKSELGMYFLLEFFSETLVNHIRVSIPKKVLEKDQSLLGPWYVTRPA